jgi:hypothetical protein
VGLFQRFFHPSMLVFPWIPTFPTFSNTENAVSPLTTPCARGQLRVNTERLAARETLLHRLGSKLNRTVLNSCDNSLSVAQKHVTFVKHQTSNSRLFPKHQTSNSILFGNTKQVIQDYDTIFDNSIPFRKNDLLRITYFRIPGEPMQGIPRTFWQNLYTNFVYKHFACRASGCTLCLGR